MYEFLRKNKPKKIKNKKLTVQVAQTQPLQRMNVCVTFLSQTKKNSALIN